MSFLTLMELSPGRRAVHFPMGPDEGWDPDRHRIAFRVSPGEQPGTAVLEEVFSNGHVERYLLEDDARRLFGLLPVLGLNPTDQGGFDVFWDGPPSANDGFPHVVMTEFSGEEGQ